MEKFDWWDKKLIFSKAGLKIEAGWRLAYVPMDWPDRYLKGKDRIHACNLPVSPPVNNSTNWLPVLIKVCESVPTQEIFGHVTIWVPAGTPFKYTTLKDLK